MNVQANENPQVLQEGNTANFNKQGGAYFLNRVHSPEKWYKSKTSANRPLTLLKHLSGSFFHGVQPKSPGIFVDSAVLNQQHLTVPICTPPHMLL